MLKLPSQFRDDANASTGLLFMKVYNLWHSALKKALAPQGLTHPQFVFLACAGYLAQTNEYVTQSMLAELSDMDMMTVSQLAVLLEKKGLISRGLHPHDSRAKTIRLSETGRIKLHGSMPVVEAIDAGFFEVLGTEERTFLAMLQRLSGEPLS